MIVPCNNIGHQRAHPHQVASLRRETIVRMAQGHDGFLIDLIAALRLLSAL